MANRGKRKPKLFTILFSDLSEDKQKEYLELSKLEREELPSEHIVAKKYIDPGDFVTVEEFFKKIRNL